MRLFIAVEIPQPIRDDLGRLQASLQALLPDLRWSKPEGIHLTLRFLGETSQDRLIALCDHLAPGAPFASFRCGPDHLGVFSSRGRPRVLFVALSGTEPLAKVASWIDARAEAGGFVRESRPYSPHLTLGRFAESARRIPVLPELPAALAGASIPVERFVLFRSILGPQGALHEPLADFPLLGGTAA